ncbi:hypothetical protein BLAT2472_50059 [Burkholderia latens]
MDHVSARPVSRRAEDAARRSEIRVADHRPDREVSARHHARAMEEQKNHRGPGVAVDPGIRRVGVSAVGPACDVGQRGRARRPA